MEINKFYIELRDKLNKVFFIGIGGISMSGLAEMLIKSNVTVVGSDKQETPITKKLVSMGAEIYYGHCEQSITDDITLVVYTAAIRDDNIELVTARKKNIALMDRAKFMGLLMKSYQYNILISGSHGKTSTTAMFSNVLICGDFDPTVSIGGVVSKMNSNVRVGGETFFVAESCEYCDSFLQFFPYVAVILNIEMDHEDYFEDIAHIRRSFSQFAKKTNPNGLIVINGDIDNYDEIVSDVSCKVLTYGMGQNKYHYTAANIEFDEHACASFDVCFNNVKINRVKLNVRGKHNILNALATFAGLQYLGVKPEVIKTGIEDFKGVARRFEILGKYNNATIVDDYAHHPTEISALLNTARKASHNELYCVFQPHTYSRTKALFNDFAQSLALADNIILTDIYASREVDPGDIHSRDIVKLLVEMGKNAVYIKNFDDIVLHLKKCLQPSDIMITTGAGDIFNVGNKLVNQ